MSFVVVSRIPVPTRNSQIAETQQSLFGMHLFDKINIEQTQTSFYITLILMSVVTWILSAISIWGVDRRHELKEKLKNMRFDFVQKRNKQAKKSKGNENEQDVEAGTTRDNASSAWS